jgi:hypothetical protein
MKPGELIQLKENTWGIPRGTLGIVLESFDDPLYGHLLKILLPTGGVTDIHASRVEHP